MITLLTDFGTSDTYVGIMKGVIFSVDPSTRIVDLSHAIAPQDIAGAAYSIYSAYKYFPAGSIHVVVVDPGVGGDRSIIAVSMDGHFFLAPDNGVLSLIISSDKVESITRIENDRYFLTPVSRTFHGRDIFAPVAGHLSRGLSVDCFGSQVTADRTFHLDLPKPYLSENKEIIGQVIHIDRFGNLITNIEQRLIEKTFGDVADHQLKISIGAHRISGLSDYYREAGPRSLLAIAGSMGFVEIAVNCGNAASFCEAARGTIVSVSPG